MYKTNRENIVNKLKRQGIIIGMIGVIGMTAVGCGKTGQAGGKSAATEAQQTTKAADQKATEKAADTTAKGSKKQ